MRDGRDRRARCTPGRRKRPPRAGSRMAAAGTGRNGMQPSPRASSYRRGAPRRRRLRVRLPAGGARRDPFGDPRRILLEGSGVAWDRSLVPGARVELAHCFQYWILSPARLPVPPSRLRSGRGTRRKGAPRCAQVYGNRPRSPGRRTPPENPDKPQHHRPAGHRLPARTVEGPLSRSTARLLNHSTAQPLTRSTAQPLDHRPPGPPAAREESTVLASRGAPADIARNALCYHPAPCASPISTTSCRRS